jgi:hypothetical protein
MGLGTCFIKPTEEDRKLFKGQVLSTTRDLIATAAFPDNQHVLVSNPVSFETEYRCYVHKNRIVSMKHYAGHWEHSIDYRVAQAAVAAFTQAPVAYALDMGLTAEGQTLLVECNDVTSLGCYGLAPKIFGSLLMDRWAQIMEL